MLLEAVMTKRDGFLRLLEVIYDIVCSAFVIKSKSYSEASFIILSRLNHYLSLK